MMHGQKNIKYKILSKSVQIIHISSVIKASHSVALNLGSADPLGVRVLGWGIKLHLYCH